MPICTVLLFAGMVSLSACVMLAVRYRHSIKRLLEKQFSVPFHALSQNCSTPPAAGDLRLYFKSDRKNLQKTVRMIFERGFQNFSAETCCVEILRFVSSHLVLGNHARFEPSSNIIRDGIASCGGFSMVFCDLVRMLGLPARYLGLFGLPNTGSHALAEVYYDSAWHLFDPTFGIFFYTRDGYDGGGIVCSAAQLVTDFESPVMMQVVDKPWQKNYPEQRSAPIVAVRENPASHVFDYWKLSNRKNAFPVAYGSDAKVAFPVAIDLVENEEFLAGEANGSWKNVYEAYYKNPFSGYFYLGGSCPHSMHSLFVTASAGSILEIRYTSVEKQFGNLGFFPLASMHLLGSCRVDREVVFKVLLTQSSASALVMCETLFWVDELRVIRLESRGAI